MTRLVIRGLAGSKAQYVARLLPLVLAAFSAGCGLAGPTASPQPVFIPSPTEGPGSHATLPPEVTPSVTVAPLEANPSPRPEDTPTAQVDPTPTPSPLPVTEAVTVQPVDLPTPPPTSTAARVSVFGGEVTLPTYPYADFLREEQDALYGMPVWRLDRAAYEASSPSPSPRIYQTLVVENDFLRLTFLPELGGRLYSARLKSTGQEIFYHNQVVKPSRYGPLLPVEDNWWLAVGGMEWAFPVQEHGYAWGVPWTCQVDHTPQGATVILRDSTQVGRVRAEVRVTLPADRATFSVHLRLVNDTDRSLPVQFWVNAALSPGGPSPAGDVRFILPVDRVIVHSRGEMGWDLPGPRSSMPWPIVSGRDLSGYSQWSDYLGFFIPYMQPGFMAVYNPSADLAVARIVPPGQVAGNKLFAFGLNFSDRSYTDDNSQYLEVWGGANRGFWPEDDIQLAPGGAVEWRETWWPLAGLGGLTFANQDVAFSVVDGPAVRILSAQPTQATLVVRSGDVEVARESLALNPVQPVERRMSASSGSPVQIQVIAPDGALLADYQVPLP